jgi:hypothetical protein
MAEIVYYWDDDKATLVEGLIKEKTEIYIFVTPMDSVEQYAEEQACFVDEVKLPEDAPAQGCFPEEVYTDPYGCLTAKLAKLALEKTIAVKEYKKAEQHIKQCADRIKAIHQVLDKMVEEDEDF